MPAKKQPGYRDDGIRRIPAPPIDGKVTLRVLVDRASLELFVNDGQAAASFVVVPDPKNRDIFIKDSLPLKIDTLVVHELKSILVGADVRRLISSRFGQSLVTSAATSSLDLGLR